MLFDQKKVPVFHGEPQKDTLSILAWCSRIDAMKAAFDWTEEQTFCNASAALFGNAQRTIDNWATLDPENHQRTWVYLKKAMTRHYGEMKDSRSFIDALFSLRPRTDDMDNLDAFTADVMDAFRVVRNTIPQPDPATTIAQGQDYTDAGVTTMLKTVHNNVLNQICMAFLVNLLPANIRTRVLESKPTTMKECVENAAEVQRHLRDRNRPVGLSNKPQIRALESEDRLEELMTNVVNKVLNKRNSGNGNSNFNRTNTNAGPKTNPGQNSNNPTGTKPKKKCTYCGKLGHGQEACFKRKNDNAPCYNGKGDPYFPASDGQSNQQAPVRPAQVFAAPMDTIPKETKDHQDFLEWV
jgi:hypothetical protein